MARPTRPSMLPPKAPVQPAPEQRAPSDEALEAFYAGAPDAKPSTSKPVDSNQVSTSPPPAIKKKPKQTTQKISLGVRLDLLPLADEYAGKRHMDRSKYINFALAEQIKRDREEFSD